MIIRPAGYSSEDDSEGGYESGYYDDDRGTKPIPVCLLLERAIENGSLSDIEDILPGIEDYENFTLQNGWKPLAFAAHVGIPEILNCILSYEKDHNISENLESGCTPLVAASSAPFDSDDNLADHVTCVDILLNSGIDLNFKDRYGVNALMMACKNGHVKIVELLLSRGAAVNDVDNDGWTALFYAVNRGDLNIIQILLKNEANANIMDKRSRYAFNIAMDKGFTQIAELLNPKINAESESNGIENSVALCITSTKNDIFDETYTDYADDVLEIVSSAAAHMNRYLHVFATSKINLRQFLLLKSTIELKEIGILFSFHRNTILERIRQFHLARWSSMSLGVAPKNAEENQPSHLMMVFTFVANLHRQLYVLRTTINYLQDDLLDLNDSDKRIVINNLKRMKTILLWNKKRLRKLRSYVNTIKKNSQPFLYSREVTD